MPTRRSGLLSLAAMLALAAAPATSLFAQAKTPTIDGFDPVAYFTEKRPVRGQSTISYDWDDKRYLFANTRNRDLFAANPDKYEPQFNGLCTGNVAVGKKVKADPTIWRIIDGKLYMFAGWQFSEAATAKKAVLAQSKWKEIK